MCQHASANSEFLASHYKIEHIRVAIQPGESLHINKRLLSLVDVLEQIFHFHLAEALELLLVFDLRLFDLLDLLLLGQLNLIQ